MYDGRIKACEVLWSKRKFHGGGVIKRITRKGEGCSHNSGKEGLVRQRDWLEKIVGPGKISQKKKPGGRNILKLKKQKECTKL